MTLDRDEVRRLLNELATRLDQAGIAVSIHVVGAAAVMMTTSAERTATKDVDSWINGGSDPATPAAVLKIVREIADETPGLDENWLNEGAAGFIPISVGGSPEEWVRLIERGGVRILIARPDVLLAMKLLAGRGHRDLPDIDALCDACDVRTVREAMQIFDKYYPDNSIKDRSLKWLEANLSP